MNTTRYLTITVLLSALGTGDAVAQWNAARLGTAPNRLYTAFGLDPAVTASFGYGRVLRLFGHPVQFALESGVAAGELDVRDFRARVQAFTSIVRWRSVHVTGSAAFITRTTDNSIYRGISFGSDFTGTFGVYRRGWFLAGAFGFDKAVITRVRHSDWYRTYFYPQARDGWYLNAGGTFHYGLTSGLTFGRTELAARLGFRRTETFDAVVPPMYVSLGIGLGF